MIRNRVQGYHWTSKRELDLQVRARRLDRVLLVGIALHFAGKITANKTCYIDDGKLFLHCVMVSS